MLLEVMNDGIETIVHCSMIKYIGFVAGCPVKTNVNKNKIFVSFKLFINSQPATFLPVGVNSRRKKVKPGHGRIVPISLV